MQVSSALLVLRVRWIVYAIKESRWVFFYAVRCPKRLFSCAMHMVQMRVAWAIALLRFLLVGEQRG